MKEMVANNRDWLHLLSLALFSHRTSIQTSTGAMPYSILYGMEYVLPLEVEISSLRNLIEENIEETKDENILYMLIISSLDLLELICVVSSLKYEQ